MFDVVTIRAQLAQRYPGCRIIVAPHEQEVIAEIKQGHAVAVIGRSKPHFHCDSWETYNVLDGKLLVCVADRGHVLTADGNNFLQIAPGYVHHAVSAGNHPAWVEVRSSPPWSPKDHFEV